MPIANKYSILEILEACRYYFSQTGRRISFEYSLVAGVNDNLTVAAELAGLLRGMNCHVNLIPVNPIKEREYQRSDRKSVEKFQQFLIKRGINATIRREMGSDINGACGQLRKSYKECADTKEGAT
jgi:23S rRNA (adenine2503-C2)-methyltransferase